MKFKFLTIVFFLIFGMLILQSVSTGRAASGGQDRTGSPGSLGTCDACHSSQGVFTNPQISIVVKDLSGTSVTSYSPGDTYTLEFTVSSGGIPSGYGMQAVVLDTTNNNIGDMLSTSTSNTQLATISNGREFVEHQGRSSTGVFKTTWIAPVSATGTVTIYGIGIAVNGATTSGDNTSATTQFALTEAVVSSFDKIAFNKSNYQLYPVPNHGNFFLKNNRVSGDTYLKVVGIQGNVVFDKFVYLEKEEIIYLQLQHVVQGVYFVEINQGNHSETIMISVN